MNPHPDHKIAVTIAGGSIGGLCAGIALRGIGCDVHIHERIAGPMEMRGAGIVVQTELLRIVHEHGGPGLPTTSCRGRRYLQPDGGAGTLQAMPQDFTSWEAIYRTLRAMFPDDRYHTGSQILFPVQTEDRVSASLASGPVITSDLFIAADGSNSEIRHRLLPDVHPSYAGYVAWRGTVDEADAAPDIRSFFDETFTFSEARSGGHILAYFIPGANADVRPGHRRLNWVWYVRATEQEAAETLVDKDGKAHRSSLPMGLARQTVASDLCARARREIHPMLAKLVEATPEPFMQTIVDIVVPRTVFGRITLTGDSAFVVRPHTAGATAKAAFDALVLGKTIGRSRSDVDRGLEEVQRLQLEYGRRLVQYGVDLGERWAKSTDGNS
jgi:2-polyprenyl-6-methoxyphenol hydroxylase-like FAD-dependent oxidoreductase